MTSLSELANSVSVTPGVQSTNGHALALRSPQAEGTTLEPSNLLNFLPAIYAARSLDFSGEDTSYVDMGQFLRIFEDVLNPISEMVDNQPYYFDPMTAPVDILNYMAEWVDLDEGDEWTLDRRRALVEAAAGLYRIRGTKEGIRRHLGIYAQGLVFILEGTQGFRLDSDARIGLNTVIGENRPRVFNVTVVVADPTELDVDPLRTLLDKDKPVDTTYVLRVVKLPVAKVRRRHK